MTEINPVPCHEMRVQFRDTDHFYRVVTWMNKNVGRGKDHWTIPGRVKRKIQRNGGKSVDKTIKVFKEDFDAKETAMFLNLM